MTEPTPYPPGHPCATATPAAPQCPAGQHPNPDGPGCIPRCRNDQIWNAETNSCDDTDGGSDGVSGDGDEDGRGHQEARRAAPNILVSTNEINTSTIEESISQEVDPDVNSQYNIGVSRTKTIINQGLFFSKDYATIRNATLAITSNGFFNENRENMRFIDPVRFIIGCYYMPNNRQTFLQDAPSAPAVSVFNTTMGKMHSTNETADEMFLNVFQDLSGLTLGAARDFFDQLISDDNLGTVAHFAVAMATVVHPLRMNGTVTFGQHASGIFNYGTRLHLNLGESLGEAFEPIITLHNALRDDSAGSELASDAYRRALTRIILDLFQAVKKRINLSDIVLSEVEGVVDPADHEFVRRMNNDMPWPVFLEGLYLYPAPKVAALDMRENHFEANRGSPERHHLRVDFRNENIAQNEGADPAAPGLPGVDFFRALFSDNIPGLESDLENHALSQRPGAAAQDRARQIGVNADVNFYQHGLFDVRGTGYGITFFDTEGRQIGGTNNSTYVKPSTVYLDYVHDTKMPFYEAEVEDIDYSNSLTVGFEVISNFLPKDYENNQNTYEREEKMLPNLYRDYAAGSSLKENCRPFNDRYCLYTSDNVKHFSDANTERKLLYPMAVNMRITTNQAGRMTGMIKKTGMDKYIMDMIIRWDQHEAGIDIHNMFRDQNSFELPPTGPDEVANAAAYQAILANNYKDLLKYFVASDAIDPLSAEAREPSAAPGMLQGKGHKLFAEVIDQKLYKYDTEDNNRSSIIENLVPGETVGPNDRFYEGQVRKVYSLVPLVPGWGFDFEDIANLPVDRFPMGLFPKSTKPTAADGIWSVFAASLNRVVFVEKLFELLENYARTFPNMLKGQRAFSETIMYKIEKHRFATATDGTEYIEEEPVQTFYLADSDEINEIDFIDTQVKYGQKYSYRVYALNFVVGNAYWYRPIISPHADNFIRPMFGEDSAAKRTVYTSYLDQQHRINTGEGFDGTYVNLPDAELRLPAFNLDVFNVPEPIIIEVPFFERIIKIKDKPPVPPDVEFLPYKGNHKVLKINLMHNVGEYLLDPIIINADDTYAVDEARKAQRFRKDSKLIFKSDSISEYYEIYRMVNKPYRYTDFAGHLHQTVAAHGSGASFIEEVNPNKKYYYTFRAGERDLISNPTKMFQVELVSHADGMFLDVQEYEIEKQLPQFTLPFKQCLHIRPSPEHRSLDLFVPDETTEQEREEFFRNAPPQDQLKLGYDDHDDKIWDKTYKLRITSKFSGRKLDINVKFKQGVPELLPEQMRNIEIAPRNDIQLCELEQRVAREANDDEE